MAAIVRRPQETSNGPAVDRSVDGSQFGPQVDLRSWATQKNFQGFLRAVRDTLDPELKPQALKTINKGYGSRYVTPGDPAQVVKAVMGEESGVVGGYLVPIDYSTALLNVVSEESFLLPRCKRVPMASRETSCPTYQTRVASGTTGVPSYFGNMVFKWGSSQAPLETEPTFEQVSLTAWDLIGYATLSNDFLSDMSRDAEEAIIRMFGQAAAWFLEYAFLMGGGTALQMPVGINGCPAQTQVARATTKTVTAADIAGMTAALLPYSWQRAIWACHPLVLTPIQQLSQYFINIELGGMHKLQPKPAGAIATRPLYVTDKLPPPGTGVNGDIILFDPSLYVWGMRQDVVVDVSPHPGFKSNQTDFRIWLRADGKPYLSQPIVLQDQTTTVSPFVVLKGK